MTTTGASILQSEEGLRTLFEYATVGILVVDKKHQIQLANPHAEKLFDYPITEMEGQKIELLVPLRFHDKHIQHRNEYVENPVSRPMGLGMDLHAKRKDGSEFPVEVSLATYHIEEEMYVVAFVNDITSRKKAEEELKEYMALLEERVKERTEHLLETLEKEKELSELKSRFVSMASHELRTPLTAILSSTNLAKRYTDEDQIEKRHKHLDKIRSSVNRLVGILDNFLSLDKIDSGKTENDAETVDLMDLIDHVIDESSGLCKSGQSVKHEHTGRTSFNIDFKMLTHILLNLVSNAIKYSRDNVRLITKVDNDILYIEINDEGIGIPKEDHDKMFELFFRAKNSSGVQGTGLGMNIVKKYVDLMEGKIDFKSIENDGTTFYVEIPENKSYEENFTN